MAEYSPSQLDKFKQCPRQYKFIYVDRIRRKDEGVEAFVGQRFHDAMEWLYKERPFRCVPLEELLDYYERDWAARWHADVKIRKRERSQDDYRLMARRFIEDYYRRHHPFDQGKVLGLEYDVRFPLDEAGRYRCKGRIDRIMVAPDGVFDLSHRFSSMKVDGPQFRPASQIVCRRPPPGPRAGDRTSSTSKPTWRSVWENARSVPADQTASTPPGRRAEKAVASPARP